MKLLLLFAALLAAAQCYPLTAKEQLVEMLGRALEKKGCSSPLGAKTEGECWSNPVAGNKLCCCKGGNINCHQQRTLSPSEEQLAEMIEKGLEKRGCSTPFGAKTEGECWSNPIAGNKLCCCKGGNINCHQQRTLSPGCLSPFGVKTEGECWSNPIAGNKLCCCKGGNINCHQQRTLSPAEEQLADVIEKGLEKRGCSSPFGAKNEGDCWSNPGENKLSCCRDGKVLYHQQRTLSFAAEQLVEMLGKSLEKRSGCNVNGRNHPVHSQWQCTNWGDPIACLCAATDYVLEYHDKTWNNIMGQPVSNSATPNPDYFRKD